MANSLLIKIPKVRGITQNTAIQRIAKHIRVSIQSIRVSLEENAEIK